MKKNRPAILLSALAPAAQEAALSHVLLEETTTLGVRVHALQSRPEARREMRTVQTPHGTVRVKLKFVGDQPLGATPEYDDCKTLADQLHLPARQIWESAAAAAQRLLVDLSTKS